LNITVTCRHDYRTDEVKDYATEKAKKLGKFYNNISKIEIVLNFERDRHSAEAVISVSRGKQLVGSVTHEDAKAAIDLVTAKLERQLVRFKERLKDHRGGRRGEETTILEGESAGDDKGIDDDDETFDVDLDGNA